jgi:hypothetical protein
MERFTAVLIKIPLNLLLHRQAILKFIWKDKAVLKKRNEVESNIQPRLKTSAAIAIKTGTAAQMDTQTDGTEHTTQKLPCTSMAKLFFTKVQRQCNGETVVFSENAVGITVYQ